MSAASIAAARVMLEAEPVLGMVGIGAGTVGTGVVVAPLPVTVATVVAPPTPPAAVVAVVAVVVVVAEVVVAVVVVAEVLRHEGLVKVFESSVTAPFRASNRPSIDALVLAEIDVSASTVPTKTELVPSVAELPTCQNTLHEPAPLTSRTRLELFTTRVLAALKMKTAFGSPCASSVSVPDSASPPPLYTPAVSVLPARFAEISPVVDRPNASLNAVTTAAFALSALASAAWMTPLLTIPGG
jgi:hypothetical protein